MKIDKYLSKAQKLVRDVFGILTINFSTSVGSDYTAFHVSVFEYDYDSAGDDYEIRNFSFYSFYDMAENDREFEKLTNYINAQRERYEATR